MKGRPVKDGDHRAGGVGKSAENPSMKGRPVKDGDNDDTLDERKTPNDPQ